MHQELFDLSRRVALVTGASTGLGKSMAQALAEAARTWPFLHVTLKV